MIEEKDYPFDKYSLSQYSSEIERYIFIVPVSRNNFIKAATKILGQRYNRDVSEDVAFWDNMNKSLTKPVFIDTVFEKTLWDLREDFTNGQLTEEEFARQFQERIQIYLNE